MSLKSEFSKNYIKKVVFEDIDVKTKVWSVGNDLKDFNSISVHFTFKNLTGTLNGTVSILQSSDPELTYVAIPTLTGNLDSATGALTLESSEFLSGNIAISVNGVGITGGTMTAVVVAKKK